MSIIWTRAKIIGEAYIVHDEDLQSNVTIHKASSLSANIFVPSYSIAKAKYEVTPVANSDLRSNVNINKPHDLQANVFIPYRDRLVAKYSVSPSENNDLPCSVSVNIRSDLLSNVMVSYQDKVTARYSITSSDSSYLYANVQILPKGNLPAKVRVARDTVLRSRYGVKSKVKVTDLLYPNKDSYVFDKLSKMNFGSEPTMLSGKGIESLISFDFDKIPKKDISLVRAILRIYLDGRTDSKISFHEIGDYWEEQGVTYVNRPSKGEPITEYEPYLGQYYIEVNVLDTVKKYIAEGGNGFYITSEDIITMYTKEFPQARPQLLVEYYIDAYYKYKDKDLKSNIAVSVGEHEYLEAHAKVNQYIFWGDLQSSVNIIRRNELSSNVAVNRHTLPSNTMVVRNESLDLPVHMAVRGIAMFDIDSSAIVTRNSLYSNVDVVYRFASDLAVKVSIANSKCNSLNANAVISRPDMDGSLVVNALGIKDLHSNVDIYSDGKEKANLPAKVKVGEAVYKDEYADLVAVAKIHRYPTYTNKDLYASVYVESFYGADDLQSFVKVVSPNLPANVQVPYKCRADLSSIAKIRSGTIEAHVYVHRYPVYDKSNLYSVVGVKSSNCITDIEANLRIRSPYLPANVTIPYEGGIDLYALVKARVRRESYLYANVLVNSDFLKANVGVANTTQSDLLAVFKVLDNVSLDSNVTIKSYPNYPYVFIM